MTVTGERVTTPEAGFNPTWQRHVAAYALCARFLPPGRVLDVGCGVGHSYDLLAPRVTVGVDVDAAALAGQARETHVADMRELPFADDAFASALAVQSIEHVPDPERALDEIARVVAAGGVTVLVTPNRLTFARPDEIVDPYHYVEYDPGQLRALCAARFEAVALHGLFGSPRYRELVAEERAHLDRLLRLDPLRARRAVPRGLRQRL
ncbi:MAG TPA: methyltransferase domain-containing protein [Solirubrobacteraceae bacterium]